MTWMEPVMVIISMYAITITVLFWTTKNGSDGWQRMWKVASTLLENTRKVMRRGETDNRPAITLAIVLKNENTRLKIRIRELEEQQERLKRVKGETS